MATSAARPVASAGRWRQQGWQGAVLWPLALGFLGNLVFRSYFLPRDTFDFRVLHEGATRVVSGLSVYADPYFLLSPSGLFVITPFGWLDQDTAFPIWTTLSIVAALAGVWAALRFAGLSPWGPAGAAAVLGLAISESLTVTLLLGNVNNTLLLALGAGYLLAESRDRRLLAGALLGLALAVKPVMVLVLLVPLVRRHWRTAGIAVAVPAVLNVVGLLLVPHRQDFLSITVPNLLTARPDANSSLWAMGIHFGVPGAVVDTLRLLVLVSAVLAVWRLRTLEDQVARLAASYGLLLTATFLSSSLSQGYYSMLLLPLLVTVARPGSPVRNPLTWAAVYLFGVADAWTLAGHPQLSTAFGVSRWTLGWVLLFAVLLAWSLRRSRAVAAVHEPGTRTPPVGPARDDAEVAGAARR